ncbi:uncharacterized protein LOC130934526 [Arachis stenosperma]|uniref:uncharacterized protein LOC130934526 n=1 Tax=Arachis stenosperma TaxID=217475 RepID=UPI0025AB6B2E|nr:uncharacterized protein LOC130934526 [Arachis stenosperma]
MVHGPCGHLNIKSQCMINGKCSKFFPKAFRDRTIIDKADFSRYQRRDNGRIVSKKIVEVDNSFIIPYNASLLLKFRCHINVKYTCQTSSIKYLFKYLHKGNDRVIATFYQSNGSQVDEICNYYDCRYISACEAAWRLFGYPIQMKEPVVIRLPFHYPDDMPILYKDTDTIQSVVEIFFKKSMLIGWFKENEEHIDARNLTYFEFLTKFVWNEKHHMWTHRKQGYAIGRISQIPPMNKEDYYLRLLVNIQKGCTSFNDLRTVDGVVYNSFKDACYALGLVQSCAG